MTTIVAESPAPLGAAITVDEGAGDTDAAKRRRLATTISILTYAALAIAVFLPWGPFDSRHIPAAGPSNPAGSDPFQMAWFLSWLPYALTHGLNLFHTTLFDYPRGVNLADNTSVPLLGLLAWPITATLGPIASFNFLVRLAFFLSGASMFGVLRRWCSSILAPFVGGLLYAFGPYMIGQELHLDLIFVPIPPLLVWCADELVRTQRMRPWRLGILIGVLSSAQLFISPDVLSGCLVLTACAVLGLAIGYRHKVRERLPYIVSASAVGLATFLLLCGYLMWYMIAGPDHLTTAVIPPASLQEVHADLLGAIAPTSNQLWAPHFLARLGNEMVQGNLSENGTYLGLPVVILLVVTVRRLRREPVIRALAWLAAASFVISLGSTLFIGTLSTHLPLPERLFTHVPLLDNTIPARYDLYVALFTSMILAIGLDRLWQQRGAATTLSERWRARLGRLGTDTQWARRARVGLVAGIAVLSLLPNVPFQSRRPSWSTALTRDMQQLIPPGSVVLTYPYTTPLHPQPLLWEATAGMNFHLLGGYANIDIAGQGHRWPALLSPPYPQEMLGYSIFGDDWPAPGPVNAADLDALHIFLARYSVGAVVYSYSVGGDNRTEAYDYLAAALGPPTLRAHRIAIWLPVNGRWRTPHAGP